MKQILLTDEEIRALAALMDAGVKSLGLSCVKNATHLLIKLEQAEDVGDSTGAVDLPTTDSK